MYQKVVLVCCCTTSRGSLMHNSSAETWPASKWFLSGFQASHSLWVFYIVFGVLKVDFTHFYHFLILTPWLHLSVLIPNSIYFLAGYPSPQSQTGFAVATSSIFDFDSYRRPQRTCRCSSCFLPIGQRDPGSSYPCRSPHASYSSASFCSSQAGSICFSPFRVEWYSLTTTIETSRTIPGISCLCFQCSRSDIAGTRPTS